MNFRSRLRREEPEMNFIPLIDLLLVILIFLMVTTTYSKFTELKVNLPEAGAISASERPTEILVAVSAAGRYSIDGVETAFGSPSSFAQSLNRVAKAATNDPMLVIYADAAASHQAVVNVLEAARLAGLGKVTFAAQKQN